MITAKQICPICGIEYETTTRCKSRLRKTCGKQSCMYALKEKNMYKNSTPKINDTPLEHLILESIGNMDCPYISVRTIIENNKQLEENVTKGMKLTMGKILTHKLGYKKISKKYYIKE